MQIPFFDFNVLTKQNSFFRKDKKQEDDTKTQHNDNSTVSSSANEENSKDKANLNTQINSTNASKDKSDSILEMLYEKLEKLQEQLKEINAKISQSTDEELRLELLSQAQNIIAQMQKIMAQIIKILNELLKQQKMQQRLDAQA